MAMFKELFEAGKNPVNITWKKSKNWVGSFMIDSQTFDIEVTEMNLCKDVKVYQYKFYRDKSVKIINDYKYAFQVHATVKSGIIDFVKSKKPAVLLFSAVDESAARKAMYKKVGGELANQFKYNDLSQIDPNNDIIFGIYKDQVGYDCIMSMI